MSVYSELSPEGELITNKILKQIEDYFTLVNKPEDVNTREFWLKYQHEWPE